MPDTTTKNLPRQAAAIGLLLLGGLGYLRLAIHFPIRHREEIRPVLHALEIVGLMAILFILPPIHRPIGRLLDWMRRPTPAIRRMATLAIWVVATAYLYWTASRQGRDFSFKTQDEFMYLVQVQALAHGHLWMPQHPLADFFQEFYIFVRPVTSSMYFPGASLMFVPAVWLHIPFAVWNLLICGAVVAMTFRVVSELVDAVAGLLAALLVISLTHFRTLSLLTLSYMPMALLGLFLFWAYLHWRKQKRWEWTVLIGLLMGWTAITRPLDAIVFGVTIAAAMAWDLYRSTAGDRARKFILTFLIAAFCALPFLSLQLLLDKAVTGHLLKTPVQRYEDDFWPGTVGGWHPHVLPGKHALATSLPQFRDNFENFVLPHFHLGKKRFLPPVYIMQLNFSLPNYLLFVFIPLGILGLGNPGRAAMWAIMPLFIVAYLFWVMFIPYYAAVIAPIVMYSIVLGAHQLTQAFPRGRLFLSVWASASITALAAVTLPEFAGEDPAPHSGAITVFNREAAKIHKPAVVFFRYHTEVPGLWKSEQTYNAQAAWFDDEPIVRAQDLGSRDTELLHYYACKQSNREVYLFDQASQQLTDLGNVARFAADPQQMFDRMKAASSQPATAPAPMPQQHRRRR